MKQRKAIRCIDRHNPRRAYAQAYSGLFLVMILVVFGYFFVSGRSFIWYKDGWRQHYKALVYFGEWLREIAGTLLTQHQLMLPEWNFSIGYGSDIITTLHYYVIGDPLDLLAVFVPTRYMFLLYDGLILLRFYLAGLFFACYCRRMGQKNPYALLAGSFGYIFCGFALFATVRHPYFMNPMVYLPLLLIGTERVLHRERPQLFVGMVFLCAVSNFYFFYMIVLLTVLYVLFRLFMLCDGVRDAVYRVLRLAGYAVVGTLLSAFLLVPVMVRFFGDSRLDTGYVYDLLYSATYYKKFLTSFASYERVGSWTFLGYFSVALLAILLLFRRKKRDTALKLAFVAMTAFLLLPTAGHVFNGFSYVSNRWIWGYSMLVAYILTKLWDELTHISARDAKGMLAVLGAYLAVCVALRGVKRTLGTLIAVCLAALVLLLLVRERKRGGTKRMQGILLWAVLLSIGMNAYFAYAPTTGNYVNEFVSFCDINKNLEGTQDAAVELAAQGDDTFYRYSGTLGAFELNATIFSGLHSTQYYWSLSNSHIYSFMKQLGLLSNMNFRYQGMDSRTALAELANVKYYVALEQEKNRAPYGFHRVDTYAINGANYRVYKNKYALPLGYTYSGCVTQEQYDTMTMVERQNALLQGVLLEEAPEGYEQAQVVQDSKNIPYEVTCNSSCVVQKGNSFVVTDEPADTGESDDEEALDEEDTDGEERPSPRSVTLTFRGVEKSETYLSVTNLNCTGNGTGAQQSSINKTMGIRVSGENEHNRMTKEIRYYTPEFEWYSNRHDFALNLGYSKTPFYSITITFPYAGVYSFDELAVVCQPMKNYKAQVQALKRDVLENVQMENDEVTGEISLTRNKILCLSIPYSAGWTAYVDGQETELLLANTMYMALPLAAGKHDIKLVYHTPGLLPGVVLSGVGLVLLLCIVLWHKRNRKREICEKRRENNHIHG